MQLCVVHCVYGSHLVTIFGQHCTGCGITHRMSYRNRLSVDCPWQSYPSRLIWKLLGLSPTTWADLPFWWASYRHMQDGLLKSKRNLHLWFNFRIIAWIVSWECNMLYIPNGLLTMIKVNQKTNKFLYIYIMVSHSFLWRIQAHRAVEKYFVCEVSLADQEFQLTNHIPCGIIWRAHWLT